MITQIESIATAWADANKKADEYAKSLVDIVNTKTTSLENTGVLPASTSTTTSSTASASTTSGTTSTAKSKEYTDTYDFISKNVVTTTKAKKDLSEANKVIYDKFGKTLDTTGLLNLMYRLHIDTSDTDKRNAKLAAKLKELGFSKGGVIDGKNLVKLSGEDGLTFVSHGESVLTPTQTKALMNVAPVLPEFLKVVDPLKNVKFRENVNPNINIDSSIHVDGVATDTLVGQMAGIAKKQVDNIFKEMNSGLYAKGVRWR